MIAERFPDVRVYFQAADIVNQVLNFGLSTPIDAQISGLKLDEDYQVGWRLAAAMRSIPGLTDVRIAQIHDYPTTASTSTASRRCNSDSTSARRGQPADIAQYQPTAAAELLARSQERGQLLRARAGAAAHGGLRAGSRKYAAYGPSSDHTAPSAQLLSNVATFSQTVEPAEVNHYDIQRVVDVNCGVEGRDLGSASDAVQHAIDQLGELPPGIGVTIRGQSQAMH
jgi:multidrug efflux pump subunit AcrB